MIFNDLYFEIGLCLDLIVKCLNYVIVSELKKVKFIKKNSGNLCDFCSFPILIRL